MTFLLSFVFIIALISLLPFIEDIVVAKKNIIGIVGQYDQNNFPEEISAKISNGLIYVNEKGESIPALASSWEIKNNGREFLFHLKNNLLWNDGKPFKASQIDYGFRDVEIKAYDDRTIVFKLKNPFPTFITYLSKAIIRPPLTGVAGLYRVSTIKSKYGRLKEVHLSPNKSNLPYYIYKFYENENQLLNAYKLGEVKEIIVYKKSIADTFKSWKNTKVIKSVDYGRLLTLFFNFSHPLLKEKDIRAAIRTGIDPSLFNDLGETTVGPIPPTSWAFNSSLKPIAYDIETAEKIIKKAIPASQEASFSFVTSYDYADLNEKISDQLKKMGINTEISYLNQTVPENFNFFLGMLKIPVDPDQYFFWHSTQKNSNVGNYVNLKIDKLLEDGRNNYYPLERKKIYLEFQRILEDDPPAVFLYYPYIYTIKRK
jgi:peptide/nickel transport system substrate-binding protein